MSLLFPTRRVNLKLLLDLLTKTSSIPSQFTQIRLFPCFMFIPPQNLISDHFYFSNSSNRKKEYRGWIECEMGLLWFLKLSLKCIDHFAWPLLALGYPLYASVQAIETDSYTETGALISYWILLSLINLFEFAFMRLLLWFQFWPYIKLMVIFWLILPDFGRSTYVYKYLVHSSLSMKPHAVISSLKNWKKLFVKKESFLLHAERYIEENGTEALEKLIASKNTVHNPDAEAANAFRVTDKEMQQKERHVQTNEERHQTEHKDITDLEVIEKKEIPSAKKVGGDVDVDGVDYGDGVEKEVEEKSSSRVQQYPLRPDAEDCAFYMTTGSCIFGFNCNFNHPIRSENQDIPIMPNVAPSQNTSSVMVETKGMVWKDTAGGELLQSSAHKEVQKEWTCAVCQVTTTCEENLNSHLHGRKHKETCEALKANNQPSPHKLKNVQSKEELKQKNIINHSLKGKAVIDHEVKELQKNLGKPVLMNPSKLRFGSL